MWVVTNWVAMSFLICHVLRRLCRWPAAQSQYINLSSLFCHVLQTLLHTLCLAPASLPLQARHWQVSPGHTCLVTGPCEETYQGLCALSDACCANEGQEHCDTAMLLTPAAARPLWEASSKSCTAQACCWACRVCMPGVAPPATHTSDLAMQQQECRLRGCFDRSLAKGSTHRQGI